MKKLFFQLGKMGTNSGWSWLDIWRVLERKFEGGKRRGFCPKPWTRIISISLYFPSTGFPDVRSLIIRAIPRPAYLPIFAWGGKDIHFRFQLPIPSMRRLSSRWRDFLTLSCLPWSTRLSLLAFPWNFLLSAAALLFMEGTTFLIFRG